MSVTHSYHHMSPEHLDRYVGEFEGRHNARNRNTIDQMAGMVPGSEGKRLRYADLIDHEHGGRAQVSLGTRACAPKSKRISVGSTAPPPIVSRPNWIMREGQEAQGPRVDDPPRPLPLRGHLGRLRVASTTCWGGQLRSSLGSCRTTEIYGMTPLTRTRRGRESHRNTATMEENTQWNGLVPLGCLHP